MQALIKSPVPIRDVRFDKTAFEALTPDSRGGIFDLACTDENGHHFIVEMQLGNAPHFIQRMKFYGLHKFNTLVERGKFDYANLPKIYCIAFLEKPVLSTFAYHTVSNLRDEQGNLVDAQMTFILVELAKFNLNLPDIRTDLDKLIYTMKTIHEVTEPTQYPPFWDEEWLQRAINELDTRKMTAEERYQFARITAINAEAVRRVNEERMEGRAEGRAEGRTEAKTESVEKALLGGKLSVEEIAECNAVSLDFVLAIQQQVRDQTDN